METTTDAKLAAIVIDSREYEQPTSDLLRLWYALTQEGTMQTTKTRGEITYDDQFGHVCTCTRATTYDDDGYPEQASYLPTVHVDRDIAPTESGSWFYVCDRCGASGWSGC